MNHDIQKIEMILDKIGVYLEEFDAALHIKDIILDSLSMISFFIEVEESFQIWIPDEVYSIDISEYTIEEFLEKVVTPLQDPSLASTSGDTALISTSV
jgi:acyl carrier protein